MRPLTLLRAGVALAGTATSAGDAALLRRAVSYLADALGHADPRFGGRIRFIAVLGTAALALYQLTSDAADLDAAIGWLEDSQRGLAGQPAHPQYANCLMILARAYRTRGDAHLARVTGLAALRGRGREVLLQSGTERSLVYARMAASEAAEIANWCVCDGSPDTAIEATELGRSLILHAATTVSGLPDLLEMTGHAGLAEEWRHRPEQRPVPPWDLGLSGAQHVDSLIAGAMTLEVPDDLRSRTIAALTGTAADRLLEPPDASGIARALARMDADALIYLLGSPETGPGHALLIMASKDQACAPPEVIPLLSLRSGAGEPVETYASAHQAMLAARRPPPADENEAARYDRVLAAKLALARWRRALEQLCDWAWPAVMLPLISRVRHRELAGPPRLVLVPVGQLSLVPWHAARSAPRAGGSRLHACAVAAVSYASSGRQLADIARRPGLDIRSSPVIVADPTNTLPFAALEAQAIRSAYYPASRFFGHAEFPEARAADGPGLPSEVLDQLPAADRPGASMLHLGCHGRVSSAAGRSRVVLAGGQSLTVEAVLRQAARRSPMAPGGLVSLAACRSDLAAGDYDEALTLATAFLAAGAVTVAAARWEIPDDATSLLMFMFHHFMISAGDPPREALRRAQMWMLDPHRSAPAEMPPYLAEFADRPELTDLTAWAGIIHQGR
jgi:hypothetical protein